jgi:hypothetical protein
MTLGVSLGCTETITKIVEVEKPRVDTLVVFRPSQWQNVVLRVDWSKLTGAINSLASPATQDAGNLAPLDITHVGSRLIYIKENAAFTQSVQRDSTPTALLTLRVPATDSADLFVVAVHNQNGVRRALKMGVKRNLKILEGNPVTLTLDSLALVDATWEVIDTTVTVVNDTIVAVGGQDSRNVKIRVADPYQVGFVPTFTMSVIKFWGTGFWGANTDGWREITSVTARSLGATTTTATIWPYVDGGLFNLSEQFFIGPRGTIRVNWP